MRTYSQQFINTVYLSVCFSTLFIAFTGLSNVQKTLLNSIKLENPLYDGDGYVSYGIIYSTFAATIWIAPSAIAILGSKYCMIIGTLLYEVYLAVHFFEIGYFVYIGSALSGLGASLLWTGQANYIVLNSNIGSLSKGVGVFWMFYQASFIPGNLFIYFQFRNVTHINRDTRTFIIAVLSGIVALAFIMFYFLKPPVRVETISTISNDAPSSLEEFKKSIHYAKSNNMLLLFQTIAFTGLHLTFLSILSASIGFSRYLSPNSKDLVPLAGVFHGLGSILGGILPQYFGENKTRLWRPVYTFGVIINSITYIIAFLSLPNSATFGYTDSLPIVPMHYGLLLFISMLAGTGDSCLHIQLYTELGSLYPHDSAPVFAVFKFIRNIFTASSFYYSNYFGLHTQIIILVVCMFLSSVTYHIMILLNKSKMRH